MKMKNDGKNLNVLYMIGDINSTGPEPLTKYVGAGRNLI